MRSRFLQATRSFVYAVALAALVWFLLAPTGSQGAPSANARLAPAAVPPPVFAPDTQPEDRELFMQAARTAWAYIDREYQPATGLVNSVQGYAYATVWDMASGLAALYSANQLGLLPDDEYDRRMSRALRTLGELRLFEGAAFNKNYRTTTGAVAGRDDRDRRVDERGYGWSAIDIGRMLVWLHVIRRTQPQHAADAEAVARRLDFGKLVEGGYLWGQTVGRNGRSRRYPEGRIPYEQYAAAGYAAWGHRADQAMSLAENAMPIEVMGVPLVADKRGHEHMTSEPFVLLGLELGWPQEMRDLALRMLDVQRERHERTGVVTIVSEDAIPRPPHYFYYYAVNLHGRWFSIATQTPGQRLESPRWVSAKAAYGWHALLPGDYTRRAVQGVARAEHAGRGWSSGVYEQTGQPTGAENVNTAGVILEAALYRLRGGRPLAEPAPAPAAASAPAAHTSRPATP
ncbi:MAG TPA: DUF3131 domain-containing protein [Longimicrobium sp.]|nr:DUF3131 domain-containing protein [Longimicrobium sp.]